MKDKMHTISVSPFQPILGKQTTKKLSKVEIPCGMIS